VARTLRWLGRQRPYGQNIQTGLSTRGYAPVIGRFFFDFGDIPHTKVMPSMDPWNAVAPGQAVFAVWRGMMNGCRQPLQACILWPLLS
jgi:hypothetical protein